MSKQLKDIHKHLKNITLNLKKMKYYLEDIKYYLDRDLKLAEVERPPTRLRIVHGENEDDQ